MATLYNVDSQRRSLVGAIFLTFVFFTSFLCHASANETFTGKCVGVIDGDTVDVLFGGKAVRIHLKGIDGPKTDEDFSNRAKQFTSSKVFGKVVEVRGKEYDRYGRLVARVISDGQDVSIALVQAGLAWQHKKRVWEDRLDSYLCST